MNSTITAIPLMRPRLPDAEALLPYLREIDANRWYSNFGPLERRLERRLAAHFGVPEGGVVCVTSGTVGLMLALAAVSGQRQGACLMPSYTFVAAAHAARATGLTPWFVDIDAATWAITPDNAQRALATADRPVAAVLVAAPFGAPVDIDAWDRFTAETGVGAVIDAAAGFDSARAGATPVVISLHATKPLAAGEGALVLGRDADLIGEVLARANFGFRQARRADAIGFNGKMSEYHAAVAHASFDAWPETRRRLDRVAQLYRVALSDIAGVEPAPGFADGWVGSTCNVAFEDAVAGQALAAFCAASIEARQWWSKGCHREPAFAAYPCDAMPATDSLAQRVVGLPFHEALDGADVLRVAAVLAAIAAR